MNITHIANTRQSSSTWRRSPMVRDLHVHEWGTSCWCTKANDEQTFMKGPIPDTSLNRAFHIIEYIQDQYQDIIAGEIVNCLVFRWYVIGLDEWPREQWVGLTRIWSNMQRLQGTREKPQASYKTKQETALTASSQRWIKIQWNTPIGL